MQIPDEVIEAAAKKVSEYCRGSVDYAWAEDIATTREAAKVIAEWARKEALKEAEAEAEEMALRVAAEYYEAGRRAALREAADDPGLRLSGHSGISIRRLRALAEGGPR